LSDNLYVYGTLMSRYRAGAIGSEVKTHSRHSHLEDYEKEVAVLKGYSLYWHPKHQFPFIIKNEGDSVEGEIYFDVDIKTIKKIDRIEGIDSGLYRRTTVYPETENEKYQAHTYVAGSKLQKEKQKSKKLKTLLPQKN